MRSFEAENAQIKTIVDGRYRKKRAGWGFLPFTEVVRGKNEGEREEIRRDLLFFLSEV
jgi:hypothetical protein